MNHLITRQLNAHDECSIWGDFYLVLSSGWNDCEKISYPQVSDFVRVLQSRGSRAMSVSDIGRQNARHRCKFCKPQVPIIVSITQRTTELPPLKRNGETHSEVYPTSAPSQYAAVFGGGTLTHTFQVWRQPDFWVHRVIHQHKRTREHIEILVSRSRIY